MVFKHDGGSVDSNCQCGAANACAAGIFRNAQQDGSVFDVHIATIFFKRKNSVRAYPGNGQIRKGKFRARISASMDSTAVSDIVVKVRRPGRSTRSEQVYIAHHLSDTRFFFLRGGKKQNRGRAKK